MSRFRDVLIVTTLDTFTSLMAGITIFGILGNLAHNMKIDDISKVVKSGTGLAFISYPDAISKFQYLPQVNEECTMGLFIMFYKVNFFFSSGICRAVLFHVIHIGNWIGCCSTKCCRHCPLRSISKFEVCTGCGCNINIGFLCWSHLFDTGKNAIKFEFFTKIK